MNELLNIVNTSTDMTYYSNTSSAIFSNIVYSFTDYFNLDHFETNKINEDSSNWNYCSLADVRMNIENNTIF